MRAYTSITRMFWWCTIVLTSMLFVVPSLLVSVTFTAEGIPAEQLTLDETTTLLRGPSGSSVTISLAGRSPHQPPRQLELERKPLPQPAVKVSNDDDSKVFET